ncbi:uncharacterized protein LOC117737932 isoform X3 [Cyclopterus lumpus]|uniref:uncharacterized protein LOC117737932 isoform X3 n=1 Tax=Cyclopterus lumpus TaxID=8103 RepID=UPI0014867CA5|nr:uncharacterized protein LOC117737932 isoform X3 [Cyclopterus lumpus]
MEAVVGLVVMLLGVSHGVVTHCDGTQDRAQCYGALGGTVVLQLMNKHSNLLRYQLLNKTHIILSVRKNISESNLIANRSFVTPKNGTFMICQLSRTDGGEYTLKTFDLNGQKSARTLQLTIQAPVSSVGLVSQCLSQGEMEVSCSSQGADSPQYSWTLDGKALTDFELLTGNTETHKITLRQHVSGRLVCSVWNNVSSDLKEVNISTCGFLYINCTSPNGTHISQWVYAANNTQCIEPTAASTTITATSHPAYVLAVLVLLLVVGVAVVCAQRKKQNNKPKEEGDQELIYADVRIVQRPGRQPQQRAEMEVEYGEVMLSERRRPTVEPAEDECMYAKVRKGR